MILQTNIPAGTVEFSATKLTKRPRFSSHRGRTWDTLMTLIIDGEKHECKIDTSWGSSHYVNIKGSWYRIPLNQDVKLNGEKISRFDNRCPQIDFGYRCEAKIIKE